MTPGERVHVFGGSPEMARDRRILIRMAQCLLPNDSDAVSICIELAAAYDDAGLDDNGVAVNFGWLLDCEHESREHTERMLLATDLLRRRTRTAH